MYACWLKVTNRIWFTAVSIGQETYSLAILLKEAAAQLAGWSKEIIGTYTSTEMLNRARSGRYCQFEVQRGLAITLLVKYFIKGGVSWQFKKKLQDMVTYKASNLLNDFAPLGKFDVVFCRNVLIYSYQETKRQILDRIAKMLKTDGVIQLRGAETVLGITDKLELVLGQRGIYKLSDK